MRIQNSFGRAFTVILTLVMLTYAPYPVAAREQAKPQCVDCQGPFGETGPWPSKAIVQGAYAELQNLRTNYLAGSLRPEDVRAAIVSSRIYFNHLEEIGFNAVMDARFKDPLFRKQVLEFSPSDADTALLLSKLKGQGPKSSLSPERIQALLALSYAQRTRILDDLSNMGMSGVQATILKGLEGLELRLASSSSRKPVRLNAHLKPTCAGNGCSLSSPEVDLCGWLELMAIGFAAGCLFGCVPCCGAALAAEIYAWLCEHGLLII